MSVQELTAKDVSDIVDALEYTAEDLRYRLNTHPDEWSQDDRHAAWQKVDRLDALVVSFANPLMHLPVGQAQEGDLTMNTAAFDYLIGEATDDDAAIAGLQQLIDTGDAWRLEGSVGRAAMSAIENGLCVLGEFGHTDYWGNYIPSRNEVKPGTKGSIEYARRMREEEL